MMDEQNQPTVPVSSSYPAKQIAKVLRKMSIHNGDVLAIKGSSPLATKENLDKFVRIATGIGLDQVVLVVVKDFNDLSILDEAEMNKNGWYRIDTLRKMIHQATVAHG